MTPSTSPRAPASSHLISRVAEESLYLFFFLLLSILMTWPLIREMGSAVSDPGDPLLNTWILDWDLWALFHEPLSLFHANIFYPAPYSLAFSENMLGIAITMLPFYIAGVPPPLLYNIALLFGFALSGYGAFVLCRLITGSRSASIAGGIFFAFVPYRFDHLAHLQHVWGGSLPLLFASLLYFWRRPGPARGAVLCAAFLFNGLVNIHWLLYGSIALVMTLLLLGLMAPLERRDWKLLLFSLVSAGILLLPVLLPYRSASELYGMVRGREEVRFYSAVPSDWFVSATRNRLYGELHNVENGHPERHLFPGLLVLALSISFIVSGRKGEVRPGSSLPTRTSTDRSASRVRLRILDTAMITSLLVLYIASVTENRFRLGGAELLIPLSVAVFLVTAISRLWQRYPDALGGNRGGSLRRMLLNSRFPPEVWAAFLWILIGALGSLGMHTFFHQLLFESGILRSLRVPARWIMISYTGLAVVAAAAVVSIARRAHRNRRSTLVAAISLALLFELRAAPIRWYNVPPPPPVYRWLGELDPGGGVVELPFGDGPEYLAMEYATLHHKPILNGVSGFFPPLHNRLRALYAAHPIPAAFTRDLKEAGASLVIVHADLLGERNGDTREWIRKALSAGELAYLGHFPNGLRGDYAFALRPIRPALLDARSDDLRGGAGKISARNLAAFLEHDYIPFTRATIGIIDQPADGRVVRGELMIVGWAASGRGIRAARAFVSGSDIGVPLALERRPDVEAILPWSSPATAVGFRGQISGRPAAVSDHTTLRVEITDGDGAKTTLARKRIRWKRSRPFQSIPGNAWDEVALDELIARLGLERSEVEAIVAGKSSIRELVLMRLNGVESDDEFIRLLYRTLLVREPDPQGFSLYIGRLKDGESRRSVVETFLSSDEFADRHLKEGRKRE